MSTKFLTVNEDLTVKEVMVHITKMAHTVDYISIIYITKNTKLVGYIKLKDLIVARANEKIADIMVKRFVTAMASDDKEYVSKIMKETNESSIAIIDQLNRIIGIITYDDLMDIIELEYEEDYTKFAAISDKEIDKDSSNLSNSIKSRLPWLLILLGLSIITSIILSIFESKLSVSGNGAIILASKLAVYLPLILGMSGNTGTQSLAVMIRYLTNSDELNISKMKKHLLREFNTGVFQGIIIGILIILMINLTTFIRFGSIESNNLTYSLVIGLSVFIALTISTTMGAVIPLIINSLKIDPAVASGPFITTLSDIITLSIYYSISLTILLPLFI